MKSLTSFLYQSAAYAKQKGHCESREYALKQVAYVLVRRMGYRLKDVAGYLGRDAATIATMLSRMNERLAGDIQEKREIERLGKIVDSYS